MNPLTEPQLRQMATIALKGKGPWKHEWQPDVIGECRNWHCAKPGCDMKFRLRGSLSGPIYFPSRLDLVCKTPCKVPDPDPRAWPLIVADLLPKVTDEQLAEAIQEVSPTDYDEAWYFLRLQSIRQAEILLRSLGIEVPK